jgi:hypothetical protein
MEIQQQQPISRVKAPVTRNAYVQLGALLGVALLAFVVTWFLIRGGNGSQKVALPPVGKPAIVTEKQLHALAAESRLPIYWAGPRSGAYELTRAADGRVWIRYLQSPSEVGARVAKYLTIGTYPTKTAFLAIKRAAVRRGGVSLKIDRGGLLVFNTSTPTSVYFGYPKGAYQVEVFDPSPQQARSLVLAGRIKPID